MKNKRVFIPVTPEEILELLQEGVNQFSSALLWTKSKENTYKTNLSSFDVDKKLISVWKNPQSDESDLLENLKNENENCYFSVSLPKVNLFFKTYFNELEEDALVFKVPDEVFKVQRRAYIRFVIPDGLAIPLKFKDHTQTQIIQKRVYDISAGGLGFLINHNEIDQYPSGNIIKNLAFQIQNKTYHVDAEIRYAKIMTQKKNCMVGLQFLNLSKEHILEIDQYVSDQFNLYFTKEY